MWALDISLRYSVIKFKQIFVCVSKGSNHEKNRCKKSVDTLPFLSRARVAFYRSVAATYIVEEQKGDEFIITLGNTWCWKDTQCGA